MAKDPAVLFYYQDFAFGTQFLSHEEVGMYIRILCHQADKGRLTEKQVLSICNTSAIPDNVREKLSVDENGLFFNERMDTEKQKRSKFSESRRNNALGGKAYAQHMEDENRDENEDKDLKERTEQRIEEVTKEWNTFAAKYGLGKVIKLSDKRKAGVRSRIKELEFQFELILQEIENSDFLRGSTGWKVDFDFVFCSANNYLKILEGKYRNGKSKQISGSAATAEPGKYDRFSKNGNPKPVPEQIPVESSRIIPREGGVH